MALARATMAGFLLLASAGCALLPEATAPSSGLIGDWVVQDIAGAPVLGRNPLTVGFSEWQRVAGASGCNRFNGAYSYDSANGGLTMTPLDVTRRLCLDPALMAQERAFLDTLQGATRVEPAGDGAMRLIASGGQITIRRPSGRRTEAAATPVAAPRTSSMTSPVAQPTKLPPATTPVAVDPLAPQPALGAPLPTASTVTPPPSTSSYPLAGAPTGAPLYPATPTPAPAASSYPYSTSPYVIAPVGAPAKPPVPTPAPVPMRQTPAAPVLQPVAQPVIQPVAQPVVPPAAPTGPSPRITAAGQIVAEAPLPPGATMRVQIRDISRLGQPATVIGQQEFPVGGDGVIFPFSVTAPTSVIGPNAQLVIVAQALSGDRLLMINDATTGVSATGAGGLSVRVVNAARTPSPSRPASVIPARPSTPAAPASAPTTAPAYTPAPYVAPPAPIAAPAEIPGSRAYRCRGEAFRIAFEDNVAYLTTGDGAVARLVRIDASDDPGAPRMFSNSILTVIRENADANARVRFARGRAALTACTAE